LKDHWLDFKIPDEIETNKRKVAQPINDELHSILVAAKATATSAYVIERAGRQVDSIKHGCASACERAGLTEVTPHTMGHTVITWMLQARVPIREVADFAGMTAGRSRTPTATPRWSPAARRRRRWSGRLSLDAWATDKAHTRCPGALSRHNWAATRDET
jgi:integrase